MGKALSLKFLVALTMLTCALYFGGALEPVLTWMGVLGLDIAFRILALYLFLYWVVIEVKNAYLEWKYHEEG